VIKFLPTGTDIQGSRLYDLTINGTKIGTGYAQHYSNRTGLTKVRGTLYYVEAFGRRFSGTRATVTREIMRASQNAAP
jgi:hypothetical protein